MVCLAGDRTQFVVPSDCYHNNKTRRRYVDSRHLYRQTRQKQHHCHLNQKKIVDSSHLYCQNRWKRHHYYHELNQICHMYLINSILYQKNILYHLQEIKYFKTTNQYRAQSILSTAYIEHLLCRAQLIRDII